MIENQSTISSKLVAIPGNQFDLKGAKTPDWKVSTILRLSRFQSRTSPPFISFCLLWQLELSSKFQNIGFLHTTCVHMVVLVVQPLGKLLMINWERCTHVAEIFATSWHLYFEPRWVWMTFQNIFSQVFVIFKIKLLLTQNLSELIAF